MTKNIKLLGLDVGERRIGVAVGDSSIRIAIPFDTIEVDDNEIEAIAELVLKEGSEIIVVGDPRNQSGEATAQTKFVENFAKKLVDVGPKIEFQDESLTSVIAEQRLVSYKKPYTKGDIDAQAAAIILQDYIESHYAG